MVVSFSFIYKFCYSETQREVCNDTLRWVVLRQKNTTDIWYIKAIDLIKGVLSYSLENLVKSSEKVLSTMTRHVKKSLTLLDMPFG